MDYLEIKNRVQQEINQEKLVTLIFNKAIEKHFDIKCICEYCVAHKKYLDGFSYAKKILNAEMDSTYRNGEVYWEIHKKAINEFKKNREKLNIFKNQVEQLKQFITI